MARFGACLLATLTVRLCGCAAAPPPAPRYPAFYSVPRAEVDTFGVGKSPLPSTTSDSTVSAQASRLSLHFAGELLDGASPHGGLDETAAADDRAQPGGGCLSPDNVFFCENQALKRKPCADKCRKEATQVPNLDCLIPCLAIEIMIFLDCQKTGCSAALALSCCNGKCVDTATDPTNCGGCGKLCGAGAAGDTLLFQCKGTQCSCDDSPCESPEQTRDPVTCACSCPVNLCPPGKVQNPNTCACECAPCADGELQDPLSCVCGCGLTSCAAGSCCGGKCVDAMNDAKNCGGCGKSCGEGCKGGRCCQGATPAELALIAPPKPAEECPLPAPGFVPCNTATQCINIVEGMVCCRLANGTVNAGFLPPEATPCCN